MSNDEGQQNSPTHFLADFQNGVDSFLLVDFRVDIPCAASRLSGRSGLRAAAQT